MVSGNVVKRSGWVKFAGVMAVVAGAYNFLSGIAAIADEEERAAYVEQLRKAYETDIDILRLASELVVDAIVEPGELRRELIARFAAAATKDRHFSSRRHGVPPV